MSRRALALGLLAAAMAAPTVAQAGDRSAGERPVVPLPLDADSLIRLCESPDPMAFDLSELFNGRPITRQTLRASSQPAPPCDAGPPPEPAERWPDAVFSARHACVKIFAPTWHGSGFFVSPDGYIATCYHVLVGAGSVVVVTPAGRTFHVAEVVAFSRLHDLAVLKVAATNVPFIAPDAVPAAAPADRLYAIGHPGRQSWQVRIGQGVERGVLNANPLVSFDISLGPGSSGGPVVDGSGHLRAIAAYTATERTGRQVALGIAPDSLPELLGRAGSARVPMARLMDLERRIATLDRTWSSLIVADHLMSGGTRASAALPDETRIQLLALAAYAARHLRAEGPGSLADAVGQLRAALDGFIVPPVPADRARADSPARRLAAAAAALQLEFRDVEHDRTHPQAYRRIEDIERRYRRTLSPGTS